MYILNTLCFCLAQTTRFVSNSSLNSSSELYSFPTGVYLPLLWEQSFCWKSPIALGYTRGHFSALVAMENDGYGNRGAGANLNTDDDVTVTFLPLVDSERKLLHIHFLSAQEVRETSGLWWWLCHSCLLDSAISVAPWVFGVQRITRSVLFW